ncbi:transcriptional regulator BolA [Roseivivax jejudonensis]|uniref:Transcriptional regulator BolA n=1 Tax=Roseivivax jejudonensis TaxID=1529041 RepID=A0A1X6ZCC2_9RHOB|nr:BolA family protein [Roseivivax jejudonensis]SLN47128.1 transcriptional regulator BolA [Roseivivax jejudonensis]
MSRTQEIETRLRQALAPTELVVRDDSEAHRGHAGYQEGGESHYHLVIRSAAFEGQSRIARHRQVHAAIGPELMGAIHALSMDLGTP